MSGTCGIWKSAVGSPREMGSRGAHLSDILQVVGALLWGHVEQRRGRRAMVPGIPGTAPRP